MNFLEFVFMIIDRIGTYLLNQGQIVWLDLFDINASFAFTVKIILAANKTLIIRLNVTLIIRLHVIKPLCLKILLEYLKPFQVLNILIIHQMLIGSRAMHCCHNWKVIFIRIKFDTQIIQTTLIFGEDKLKFWQLTIERMVSNDK